MHPCLGITAVSTAGYGNVLGEELCQACLREDTARKKEAMTRGLWFQTTWVGGSGRVGHIQATSPKSWEKLCYVSPALVTGQASKHAAPSSSVVMFAARISPEHRLGGLGSFEAAHPLLSTCNSQCRAPQVSPGCRTLSLLPVAESREMELQNHPHAARPRCLQGPRAAPVPAAPPGEN